MSEEIHIPKILFVDDEPDLEAMIRQRFRSRIRNGEMHVDFAVNGKDALEKIKGDQKFDIIFTDINMPVMDGLELLKNLYALGMRHMKTIVVSAYGDMYKIRHAMNSGAFDFITKPVDFDDMEVTLRKALEEGSVVREAEKYKTKLVVAEVEKNRAVQSEKFKQQFLANMSHEIRTPMNAIIGMARLAMNTELNEQQEKYLSGIRQSGENLLVIINDILDFSKIEAGKIEFENISFSPAEVLKNVYDTLQFKAHEKSLHLHLVCGDDVPAFVCGDPVRLNQVLINLAGNSIKFTEKGNVTITCTSKNVEDKNVLRFEVKDTGIGIAADKIGQVFESFSQARSDTTRKYGGTGLGLTISKEFVERQGGRIGAESKLGEGTVFWLEIPYGISDESIAEKKVEKEEIKLENLKILLVEDNEFNQMVAVDTLEEMIPGVKIDVAENGRIAVEKVLNTIAENGKKFPYDVVLMDVQMPEMDGFEATKCIREAANESVRKIPIIALTANAVKEEVEKCKLAGMDDFVTKPFDPDLLMKKISMYIS